MGNQATRDLNLPTELTEHQIELLMANTNFDRSAILEWYQGFMSDCPNGKLDRRQFAQTFTQLYPNGDGSRYSDLVFNTFDVDKNGFITFYEFLFAISAMSSGDMSFRLHLLFKVYDLNSNGLISLDEMESVIEALFDLKGVARDERVGDNSAKTRVKQIFQRFDKDHSNDLSEEEFVNGCLSDPFIMSLLLPTDSE